MTVSRREVLTKWVPGLVISGALVEMAAGADMPAPAGSGGPIAAELAAGFGDGVYKLPPLPYAYDALEPSIDAETMRLHHDKHHLAYVNGLNHTLKELASLRKADGEINPAMLTALEEDLSFNGSGHILHSIFWAAMGPHAGGEPANAIGDAIQKDFGSVAGFRDQFSKGAATVKGSGWAVLAYEPLGDLLIVFQVKQHDLQTIAGAVPLLPLDVWEHAYYLKYHNLRADYIKAWWNVVNWPAINEAYMATRSRYGKA